MIHKFTRVKPLLNYSNIIYYNLRKYCLNPPWKVLFFGTDEFSVESLKALTLENKAGRLLSSLEVVTSVKTKKNSVEKYALAENLIIRDYANGGVNCDGFHIGIVVSFGHLITARIIESFKLGMLNVHASLLPRWRGAAPIVHAISNGDLITGVTVMRIRAGRFDVGEIVKQETVPIAPHIRMPELYSILAKIGSETLILTLENLNENLENATPQPVEGVTYAPKINSNISAIIWGQMTAYKVYNLDRALTGIFHLTTRFNALPVKLYDISLNDKMDASTPIVPGLIRYNKNEKVVCVQCADGNWINVKNIGIPGKRLSAKDFNNGFLNKLPLELKIFK